MKKYYIITLLVLTLSCLFSSIPEIYQISILEDEDNENITINYALSASGQCQIVVVVSNDGGDTFNIYPTALTGHVGNSVFPTGRKQIVWNYSADNIVPGNNFQIKLIARDNPNEDDDNFLSFTKIEGGTFHNGTADVTLSTFFMDKYETTQGEYEAVMGNNPSVYSGADKPVESLTWFEAVEYCNTRSLQEGLIPCYDSTDWTLDLSANGYHLPTEMEWMFAGKGGILTPETGYDEWAGTNVESELIEYAWYDEITTFIGISTHPVGNKLPNDLGLYDMSGNVWEWCSDWEEDYNIQAETNPVGPSEGYNRIARGGHFRGDADKCKIDFRGIGQPTSTGPSLGFRAVRRMEESPLDVTSTPTITPEAGNYDTAKKVSISSGTGRADIYYTIDGSEPNLTSTKYTEHFTIIESTTVKAKAYRTGYQPSETITSELTITQFADNFILVEGGTFYDENTGVDVTVGSFFVNKYELTQSDYQAVITPTPSYNAGQGDDYPVYNVTWYDAIKYCNQRSIDEGLTPCYTLLDQGTDPNSWSDLWDSLENALNYSCDFQANGYRLPTVKESKFAAKGGVQTPATGYNQYPGTDELSDLTNYAWYEDNNGASGTELDETKQVGTKLPNQLGLYDMAGNVAEWCWEEYPVPDNNGRLRTIRGGYWNSQEYICRVYSSAGYRSNQTSNSLGFRLFRSAE